MSGKVNPNWVSGHYRFYEDDAGLGAATPLAGQDLTATVDLDTNFRLRINWGESAEQNQSVSIAPYLQYRINAGSWVTVGAATAVFYNASGQSITDGDDDTADRITTAPTGCASSSGTQEFDDNNTTTARTWVDEYSELEFCLQLDSASISASDNVEFQLVYAGDTALDSYDTTPDLDVPASGGVTGTLDATDNGPDVAALSGGVLVAGSLDATEAGSDVAAFTGTVGSTGTGTITVHEHGAGVRGEAVGSPYQTTEIAQTLDSGVNLLIVWSGFYHDASARDLTNIEWGDGTNWSSLTKLSEHSHDTNEHSEIWYLKNPEVTDDRIRFTFNGDAPYESRNYAYVALEGADVDGTEGELFPDAYTQTAPATPATVNDTFTGGADGDYIWVAADSYQASENDSLILTNESQSTLDAVTYSSDSASEYGTADKLWEDGTTVEGVGDYIHFGAVMVHPAAGGAGGITGTLDATETGADSTSFSGAVTVAGTLSTTDIGPDTANLAGGVLVAGSLSVTETGADSASLAGSILVAGSLVATETGADTAAFTGTVSDPAITGTLDATETGPDTAALAGGVLVSGSIDSTESGSDTASIAGSITVAGIFNATETGQDTAAFTGTVGDQPISGVLDATEDGSDTAAIAGSVDVTGTVDATETGPDIAAIAGTVLVSGSLDTAETGADIAAFTGVVGEVGITGELAATETGPDAATFTGGVVVAGTLTATEAGPDFAALSGTVLIAGSLSVSEAGSDTAAVSGSVEVAGTLAANEVGSDTAAFAGTVGDPSITGILDAVEIGSDVAALSGDVLVSGSVSAIESGEDSSAITGSVLVAGQLSATEAGQDTAAFTGTVGTIGVAPANVYTMLITSTERSATLIGSKTADISSIERSASLTGMKTVSLTSTLRTMEAA